MPVALMVPCYIVVHPSQAAKTLTVLLSPAPHAVSARDECKFIDVQDLLEFRQ